MKKALCIGNVSYDITMLVQEFPLENTKNRIDKKVECGGGPASNAAFVLGRYGIDTTFIGSVGNDTFGQRIINEFNSIGVHTEYMTIDPEIETTMSFIVVNELNGSRTTFAHRPKDLHAKLLKKIKTDLILVDGQELETSIKAIKENPKAITIIDAGRVKEEVITLAKMVQYLVCSKNFAEEYTGLKLDTTNPISMIDIYEKLEHDFKNTIVITLESKGSLYKKDGKIKIMPSIQVKQVDSTGAGDIYHGAFAYALLQGFDLEKTIKFSNIVGALSVTKVGSRYSVFPLKDVMTIYDQI